MYIGHFTGRLKKEKKNFKKLSSFIDICEFINNVGYECFITCRQFCGNYDYTPYIKIQFLPDTVFSVICD